MASKPPFVGEKVKLGEVCDLVLGQSPPSDSYNVDGVGLPFFQGNADFGKEHPVPRTWCDCPKKIARPGDLLISVRAPIGAINTAIEECCIGRGIAAITPNPKLVNGGFLMQQLLARRNQLESKGTGSTFKAVGKSALYDFPVLLFPLQKQALIDQELRKVQSIVSICERRLAGFDQLVKSRFVEMFGDSFNDQKYKVLPLKDVLSEKPANGIYKPQKEYVQGGKGTPIIRIDSFEDRWPGTSCLRRLNCSKCEIEKYGLRPGDIVINRVNSVGNMGKVMCVGKIDEPVVFESNMMRFHPDESIVSSGFLVHQMRGKSAKHYFEANAKRAIGQASINQKDVNNLPIILPPLEKQREFLFFVTQVDKSRFVEDLEPVGLRTRLSSFPTPFMFAFLLR